MDDLHADGGIVMEPNERDVAATIVEADEVGGRGVSLEPKPCV
jgi:hypothetical protein